MSDKNISGQGYLYGASPFATNPFYDKDTDGGTEISGSYVKSAEIVTDPENNEMRLSVTSVADGTETTQESNTWSIKGEQGEKGETGATGATGATPDISVTATVENTTGTPTVTVTKTGTDEEPAFNLAFSGIKGEKGESAETADAVTDVAITNENGVYTLKQTKAGTESEIGTIEVPEVDTSNIIAEISDSVVENTSIGYDFHTLRETEYNGTVNDVGHFYIGQTQYLKPVSFTNNGILFSDHTINQSGVESESDARASYLIYTSQDITFTDYSATLGNPPKIMVLFGNEYVICTLNTLISDSAVYMGYSGDLLCKVTLLDLNTADDVTTVSVNCEICTLLIPRDTSYEKDSGFSIDSITALYGTYYLNYSYSTNILHVGASEIATPTAYQQLYIMDNVSTSISLVDDADSFTSAWYYLTPTVSNLSINGGTCSFTSPHFLFYIDKNMFTGSATETNESITSITEIDNIGIAMARVQCTLQYGQRAGVLSALTTIAVYLPNQDYQYNYHFSSVSYSFTRLGA